MTFRTIILVSLLNILFIPLNGQTIISGGEKSETVGEINSMGVSLVKLSKSGENYTFSYLNWDDIEMAYGNASDFTINMTDDEFNSLYKIIIDGFKGKSDTIKIDYDGQVIGIQIIKSLGAACVISKYENGEIISQTSPLQKKKIKKLFNK